MMRITVRVHAERHSTTALKHGDTGRWYLVPTTSRGGAWKYHWDKVIPGDYRTQKEAMQAKKEMRQKGLI